MKRHLYILGIRGIPAEHGGFETFAENLALYLVERGWAVTVYCHAENTRCPTGVDQWRGIRRIHIGVKRDGAKGTVLFDWRSIRHAISESPGLVLTLGYNTAIFNALFRLKGVKNIINMDGIEWSRAKWGGHERAWLWLNERIACKLGNHLIADHPEIAKHLATRVSEEKISTIAYGAPEVLAADETELHAYELQPGRYVTVIARPEPENSILTIVSAFTKRRRGYKLVLLGNYDASKSAFHRSVLAAANDEVAFVGPIYDKGVLDALRFFSRLYIHGHQVGGTNPSLVEALGAGSPVLAHDNRFNRWVAGAGAGYFSDEAECASLLDELLDDDLAIARMRAFSRARFQDAFRWASILSQYERVLTKWYGRNEGAKPMLGQDVSLASYVDATRTTIVVGDERGEGE